MFSIFDRHRIKFDLLPLIISLIWIYLLFDKYNITGFDINVIVLILVHIFIALIFLIRIFIEIKNRNA